MKRIRNEKVVCLLMAYAIFLVTMAIARPEGNPRLVGCWNAAEWEESVRQTTYTHNVATEHAHKAYEFLRYEWLTTLEVAKRLEEVGSQDQPIYEHTLETLEQLQSHGLTLFFESRDYEDYNYEAHIEAEKMKVREI